MMKIYNDEEKSSQTKEKMPSNSVLNTILAFSKSLEVLQSESEDSLAGNNPIEITLN